MCIWCCYEANIQLFNESVNLKNVQWIFLDLVIDFVPCNIIAVVFLVC